MRMQTKPQNLRLCWKNYSYSFGTKSTFETKKMKMVVKLKANVAVGGLKFPQLTCEWLGQVLDTDISVVTWNNMSEKQAESRSLIKSLIISEEKLIIITT